MHQLLEAQAMANPSDRRHRNYFAGATLWAFLHSCGRLAYRNRESVRLSHGSPIQPGIAAPGTYSLVANAGKDPEFLVRADQFGELYSPKVRLKTYLADGYPKASLLSIVGCCHCWIDGSQIVGLQAIVFRFCWFVVPAINYLWIVAFRPW